MFVCNMRDYSYNSLTSKRLTKCCETSIKTSKIARATMMATTTIQVMCANLIFVVNLYYSLCIYTSFTMSLWVGEQSLQSFLCKNMGDESPKLWNFRDLRFSTSSSVGESWQHSRLQEAFKSGMQPSLAERWRSWKSKWQPAIDPSFWITAWLASWNKINLAFTTQDFFQWFSIAQWINQQLKQKMLHLYLGVHT